MDTRKRKNALSNWQLILSFRRVIKFPEKYQSRSLALEPALDPTPHPESAFIAVIGRVETRFMQSAGIGKKPEETIGAAVSFLETHPTANGLDIGRFINEKYNKSWAKSSEQRIGNSLKQWGQWILSGKFKQEIPSPPV